MFLRFFFLAKKVASTRRETKRGKIGAEDSLDGLYT